MAAFELSVAGVVLGGAAAGTFALGGNGGALIAVIGFSALGLAVLAILLPPRRTQSERPELAFNRMTSSLPFGGYWRILHQVQASARSKAMFDAMLRPQLEQLLAARLSQRHGVNLYRQPERARQIFTSTPGASRLWEWVDPGRPVASEDGRGGIPRRSLEELVKRIERL